MHSLFWSMMGRKRKYEAVDDDDDVEGNHDHDSRSLRKSPLRRTSSGATVNDSHTDAMAADWDSGQDVEHVDRSGRRELHPLLNELILINLFQFCPAGTLATCRVVCRKWRDESLPAWRSFSTLSIRNQGWKILEEDFDSPEFIPQNWAIHLNGYKTTTSKFSNYLETPCVSSKPYRRLRLIDWHFEEDRPGPKTKTRSTIPSYRFWHLIGANLTVLKMYECTFSDADMFRKIIFQSCPILQSLKVNICTTSFSEEDGFPPNGLEYSPPIFGEQACLKSLSITWHPRSVPPVSWLELLSHFPFLTSLKIKRYLRPQDASELPKLLRAINMIRMQDGDKLPLSKTFEAGVVKIGQLPESKELLDLYRSLSLPIKELHICRDDRYNGIDEDDIQGLIEQTSGSLVTIFAQTKSSTGIRPIIPSHVRFENLKLLSVKSDDFCSNLGFIRNTPNLENLYVMFQCPVNRRMIGIRTKLISNTPIRELVSMVLKNLTNIQLDYVVSDEDLRRLIGWMPHVKCAELFLTNSQFEMVCENWKGLEELKVMGRNLTDEGVTGRKQFIRRSATSITNCKKWTKKKIQVPPNPFSDEDSGPNITLLQNLKQFTGWKAKLTDASVFHGFLKLPNLHSLTLCNSQIGNKAKDKLRDKKIHFFDKYRD